MNTSNIFVNIYNFLFFSHLRGFFLYRCSSYTGYLYIVREQHPCKRRNPFKIVGKSLENCKKSEPLQVPCLLRLNQSSKILSKHLETRLKTVLHTCGISSKTLPNVFQTCLQISTTPFPIFLRSKQFEIIAEASPRNLAKRFLRKPLQTSNFSPKSCFKPFQISSAIFS